MKHLKLNHICPVNKKSDDVMPFRQMNPPPYEWNVKVDAVYRILDNKRYLNQFFADGSILVSTLERMKKYDNEMRGDPGEGTGILGTLDIKGPSHLYLYDTTTNAYVLCTTSVLSEAVIKDFKGVGAIKINDPTHFGLCIAARLPEVLSGCEGHCDYVEHRNDMLDPNSPASRSLSTAPSDEYKSLQQEFRSMTPGTEGFRKLMKHAHQREYRFLWFTSRVQHEARIIRCPEAIEHCTRIDC
ncbi:MAG: hypothetical protein JNM62_11990 [Flavobacteriales bacterium]|nr:hypothetical protein [Flavobacteriales bacterium]